MNIVTLTAAIHRFVVKRNLGAHTIFVVWIFLETQWYSNPAFKQLIMSLYAHTGLWAHALVPVALVAIANYRDSLTKDAKQQATQEAQ